MTEAELQSEIFALCKKYRLHVFHVTDARRTKGQVGYPDLTIAGTRLIFAELKSDYGQLSAMQQNWKYRLRAAGQAFYVWYPRDLADGTIDGILSQIAL
jgi:hypothetical protein